MLYSIVRNTIKLQDIGYLRFFHEEDDKGENNCRIDRTDAICPTPGGMRYQEAKCKWRQEWGYDKAHSPNIELSWN
jgi:hypothetical protein